MVLSFSIGFRFHWRPQASFDVGCSRVLRTVHIVYWIEGQLLGWAGGGGGGGYFQLNFGQRAQHSGKKCRELLLKLKIVMESHSLWTKTHGVPWSLMEVNSLCSCKKKNPDLYFFHPTSRNWIDKDLQSKHFPTCHNLSTVLNPGVLMCLKTWQVNLNLLKMTVVKYTKFAKSVGTVVQGKEASLVTRDEATLK